MAEQTPRTTRSSRPIVIGVVAVIVIGVLGIAALLLTRGASGDGDAGASDQGGSANPAETASLTPEQEAAREEAIALMRDEPRREEGDPYAKGEVDAPVVLIEFADFRCPYCAKHVQETEPLLEKYIADGTLRVEWRDLPIFGEDSEIVHRAARAAGRQGMFWEYHDAIFAQTPLEGHREWDDAQLRALAEEIGVPDLERWEADREDPALAEEIEAERAHASDVLGITATPAFILGDVFIPGAYPLATFVQQIEAQAGA